LQTALVTEPPTRHGGSAAFYQLTYPFLVELQTGGSICELHHPARVVIEQ
jgi:hypothetical protein